MIVDAIGLDATLNYFKALPGIARQSARLAINQTAGRTGLQAARKAMATQIVFPAGYLQPPRFGVTKLATDDDLSASITGQFTPTPLGRFASSRARFARTGQRGRGPGVTVQINR